MQDRLRFTVLRKMVRICHKRIKISINSQKYALTNVDLCVYFPKTRKIRITITQIRFIIPTF